MKFKMKPKDSTFYHTGCIGDIIASLPIIRALGGGRLVIGNHDPMPPGWRAMEGPRYQSLAPLLDAQPYIRPHAAFKQGFKADYDFSQFRNVYQRDRLITASQAEWIRKTHPLGPVDMKPWLTVKPSSDSRHAITIGRTHRYRNSSFPWRRLVMRYGKRLIFLGLEDEYEDFIYTFGGRGIVTHAQTPDLLRMAELIAGSSLFIGNQSCHCWIAMGLGHPLIQETSMIRDSIVGRTNAKFVKDGNHRAFSQMGVPL